jgi:peptide deformylase
MARLTILEYPDARLTTVAARVTVFDAALGRLIEDLVETMYAAKGIGLAATQVDVHLRLIAIDVAEAADCPQVFINPEILASELPGLVEEGCLSLPGVYENVKRATRIRVRFQDRDGTVLERDLDGMAAVCVQHEMDHLQGKLFVDRLSFFKRRSAIKRLLASRLQPKGERREAASG